MPEWTLTPDQIHTLARSWWLAVALGLGSLIAGGIVLARPDHSLRTLAVIIGIFVLIDGVVELYLSLARRIESRGTTALLTRLNVIVGVLLIRHPIAGVQAIALLIGTWLTLLVGFSFLANGVAMIVFGILLRTLKYQGRQPEAAVAT